MREVIPLAGKNNRAPIQQEPTQDAGRPTRTRRNIAKKTKRRHPILRAFCFFLVGLLLVCGGLFAYAWSILSGMRLDPTATPNPDAAVDSDYVEPGVDEPAPGEVEPGAEDLEEYVPTATQPPVEMAEKDDDIINYLLVGLDARKMTDTISGNTDVMIIMTLDKEHNKIKLTSLMRDILVDMPGQSSKKRLNAANSYLGIDGAIELIENTFGIPIDGFAAVNFIGLGNAIDVLGGVTIDVQKNEVAELNRCLLAQQEEYGYKNVTFINSSGTHKLSGQQALAYMRIRHISGGDFNRTARQRNVLRAVFGSVKDLSEMQLLQLAFSLTDSVRTNLAETEMIAAVANLYTLRGASVEELRIPMDNTYKNARYNGMAILDIDFEVNSQAIKDFIYE